MGKKNTKFSRTIELQVSLRDWLHERNMKRQRTVARDVLNFIVDCGKLPSSIILDNKALHSALRTALSQEFGI